MNSKLLITMLVAVVVISGSIIGYKVFANNEVAEITLQFTENGLKQNVGDVRVKGGTANVTYHIINTTGQTITPLIENNFDVNPDAYKAIKGQGYDIYPLASRYVAVSGIKPIINGDSARINIVLDIPEEELNTAPDKWVFITLSASNTGGFVQIAPYIWWIITMR
jgi:hypothetical protein